MFDGWGVWLRTMTTKYDHEIILILAKKNEVRKDIRSVNGAGGR